MLTQIINNTNKPVTIKFRLGMNKKIETFLEVGKLAEDLGVSMVTLHARYAEQGYSGSADWNKIKLLKESLNVPVVGNGDVSKPELALKMFEETNVDFLTVGRWAQGNPWCFSQINSFLKTKTYEEINPRTKILGFLEYLKEAQNYNIAFARKKMHAMQFTKGIIGGVELRRNIATAKTEEQIINTMNSFLRK
jgi:tRNA-dihydrouridine synthase B